MKPILFNTIMVQALLEGRKTTTRRAIKPKPAGDGSKPEPLATRPGYWNTWGDDYVYRQPYQVGDILYVRETFATDDVGTYHYRADGIAVWFEEDVGYGVGWRYPRWRPAIHMPKEAARIFLRVTDVRAERLQDIDDAGVVAEGLSIGDPFDELWDSTLKKADRSRYGWDANPWVWVIEFECISREEAIRNEAV